MRYKLVWDELERKSLCFIVRNTVVVSNVIMEMIKEWLWDSVGGF